MSTYLLAPWLDDRACVALLRSSGCDASQLALAVSLAVAGGRGLSGWQATCALDVLHVTDREGLKASLDRLDILRPAMRPSANNEALARLHLLTMDDGPPDLTTPAGGAWIFEAATRIRPSLVVLDGTAPVALARALRELGCAVMLVMTPEDSASSPLGYVSQLIDLRPSTDGLTLSWRKPGGFPPLSVALPAARRPSIRTQTP